MPYYAVRKGYNVGIYTTWDACKAQIHQYSGAEFKKFKTKTEAINFINNTTTNNKKRKIDNILSSTILPKKYT